jgi:hypothetical protein
VRTVRFPFRNDQVSWEGSSYPKETFKCSFFSVSIMVYGTQIHLQPTFLSKNDLQVFNQLIILMIKNNVVSSFHGAPPRDRGHRTPKLCYGEGAESVLWRSVKLSGFFLFWGILCITTNQATLRLVLRRQIRYVSLLVKVGVPGSTTHTFLVQVGPYSPFNRDAVGTECYEMLGL